MSSRGYNKKKLFVKVKLKNNKLVLTTFIAFFLMTVVILEHLNNEKGGGNIIIYFVISSILLAITTLSFYFMLSENKPQNKDKSVFILWLIFILIMSLGALTKSKYIHEILQTEPYIVYSITMFYVVYLTLKYKK